ncbi:hypothetical protein [Rubrobacter radiotolerans]|uniref:Uncharacterized protein n=1 Tax=Rubrobacter radiotolerans TaxID=42256 RepID=A0AB35T6J5_RUBRA|nr:hypothetical protein [Rubrobacter radiotolerans]MDX5895177.1 hypothetical protein [Rubrobacter radiotolerans]SMC07599.1 hypothetical protein SAMN00767673_2492 [Rubrobacter radiotolerans DSM 5868]
MTVSRTQAVASAKPKRKHYDKDLIRERTFDLLTISLSGAGRDQGTRLVWNCPACGKRDKYSVKKDERRGGCMVEGCRLAGYDDILLMLAKIHDLDYYFDFRSVLVKAYDLLGLQPAEKKISSAVKSKPTSTKTGTAKTHDRDRQVPAADDGELASLVYGRIMGLCPLESRDRSYLRSRGISLGTIRDGRFGSMTPARARKIKATLQSEFDREVLLRVPGFSEDERDGHLKFTLSGNYLLIPYHDRYGRISTIEGRSVGEAHGRMGKYVSLRDAGNHLYVFLGHDPEELQAVCEGVMGAIVAAESGLSVGSIQGCQRFRSRVTDGESGASYAPLPELRGVDFGGRTVPYIPDADDPPNPTVLRAAPKAARWISEPQNGKPAICLLPAGQDLDEWLLSIEPENRVARFAELLASASPPEDGLRVSSADTADRKESPVLNSGSEAPPRSPDSEKKKNASGGARRLRHKVYEKLLDLLPLKSAHAEAFSKLGVWEATLDAGCFVSLDSRSAEKAASELVSRFGARRLRFVPGFELDEDGTARIPAAASGEFVLAPCFDSEGMISNLVAVPFDGETGVVSPDESVPFFGCGSCLYVFAPYDYQQVVGLCQGLLGSLLTAQEDIAVGAICRSEINRGSTPDHETDQHRATPFQTENVDLGAREIAYLSFAGDSERGDTALIARNLIKNLNGRVVVKEFSPDETEDANRPVSLGKWMLAQPENAAGDHLRDLLGIENDVPSTERGGRDFEERRAPIPAGVTYSSLLISAALAAMLDAAILRVQAFAGFVSVGIGGEQIVYAGRMGYVRRLLDSIPANLVYEFREPVALLFGISLTLGLISRYRIRRSRADQNKKAARHRNHPGAEQFVVKSDLLWAVVTWLTVFMVSRSVSSLAENILATFSLMQTVPSTAISDAESLHVALLLATASAVFVLWRRISMRLQQARMLRGEIRH